MSGGNEDETKPNYCGESNKGGFILAAAIVIGNLNIIILPLISIANPVASQIGTNPRALWVYWIPRIVHDVLSFWSVAFWFWAVVDAVTLSKKDMKENNK